jgi:thiamine biosynthesis lipoprotein
MNRRDFLHPHRLATSAGHVIGALQSLQSSSEESTRREDIVLLRAARRAMATTFEILLPFGTVRAQEAAESGLDLIDALEDQLTVFRETSEVSVLNRRAGEAAVSVEEGLFQLLNLAGRISRETGGAYDITTGALTKAWGFYRRAGRVPTADERRETLTRTGMRNLVLDFEEQTVRYLRPGLEINLGSIGKGYALDRVAELLRRDWEIDTALLHGGRSSVYAMGSEPGDSRGWLVGVRHPWNPERRLVTVRLRNRGLATSAATFQNLEYNGRKLGHILDPRTGWPAEGMASATVLAPTAAEADALSTAFFVLGIEGARRYCEAHPDTGALLLPADDDAPVILGIAPNDIELERAI